MEEMRAKCVFKLFGGIRETAVAGGVVRIVIFLMDALRDEAWVHAVIVNAEHVANCTNKLGELVGFIMWRRCT